MVGILLVIVVSACGGNSGDTSESATEPNGTPTASPAQSLEWGEPAEVLGYEFNKVRVTPQAVLYNAGSDEAGEAENGTFVVISVKAEPLTEPDTIAFSAAGGGFEWRGAGQTITEMDGESANTAWVGAVPEFTSSSPIEPGDPREGILTFDVPARGERLVYLSPEDHSIMATWNIPTADQGSTPGMEKVRKRIKLFS